MPQATALNSYQMMLKDRDPQATLAEEIRKMYLRGESQRVDMLTQFVQSRYITYSRQALAAHRSTNGQVEFTPLQGVPAIPQMQINTLFGTVRKIISKMTQRELDFEPVGYVVGNASVQAVNAARPHIAYLKDKFHLHQHYMQVNNYLPTAGEVCLKMFTVPEFDEQGGLLRRNIRIALVNPWELTLDLNTVSPYLTDHEQWIHTYTLPVDEAKRRFNLPSVNSDGEFDVAANTLGHFMVTGTTAYGEPVKSVMIHEHYDRRPHVLREFPHGRTTILIGKDSPQYILSGNCTLPCRAADGESPLVKFDAIQAPGRNRGMSPASLMILEHLGYNQIINDIAKSLHISNQIKVLAAEGSIRNPDELRKVQSGVVEYTPGLGEQPRQLQFSGPQAQSWTLAEMIQNNKNRTFGVSDINYGESQGRVESASAYRLLLNESDSIASMMLRQQGHIWSRFMDLLLRSFVYHGGSEEMLHVIGDDGFSTDIEVMSYEVLERSRMRIQVKASSLTPKNEEDMRREAMQVAEMAARGGSVDLYMRLTNSELIDRIAPETASAKTRALEENRHFANMAPEAVEAMLADAPLGPEVPPQMAAEFLMYDMPLAPHDFEVHDVHIHEHRKFMNRPEFYTMPEIVRQLLIWHVQAHELYRSAGAQVNDLHRLQQMGGLTAPTSAMPSGENYEMTPSDVANRQEAAPAQQA